MTPTVGSTLNIAHRGARSLAPENTLAAAQKGFECGADMWELDVGLSADGALFLVHDDTLNRTSNVAEIFPERAPWQAHHFTFAEIQQLDFGTWFNQQDPFGQIAAGNVSETEQASYLGVSAPTLEEALLFTRERDWRVNVEIKDLSGTPGDVVVVEQVVTLIEALGMVDQVFISSFNHRYIERAKQTNPELITAALIYEAIDEVPVDLLRRLKAQALNPLVGLLSLETITSIREAGFDVHVYTVNDEPTMRNLIEAGVSGLFTDFPQRLKAILERY